MNYTALLLLNSYVLIIAVFILSYFFLRDVLKDR